MAETIVMPQAGQSMTEGKIVEWYVKEGDRVKRGDPLLSIETDKANIDVEAPAAGILRKVFHRAGEVVPVLKAVAVIGAADEAIDFEALRGAPAAPAAAPAAPRPEAPIPASARAIASMQQKTAAGRPRSSPLARRLARVRGIEIGQLRGSGPEGRIIRRDVESAAANGRAAAGAPTAGASPVSTAAAAAPPYPPPAPRPAARVPIEGMRKAIAAALQRSKVDAPHFYATVEIDVSSALELRRGLEARGVKVSVNDLVLRAAALALADEPRVNCRVFADRIEYPTDVNIGIAVGLEEGLVVPVVLRAQERDLAGIAAETRRLAEAARGGKLIGSGQGTFTISNLGMFGVESFTAIINPPEGAILAVGAAAPRLVPMAGGLFQRTMMKVTLSADHRAIDGLLAARFLARLRHLLEHPSRL